MESSQLRPSAAAAPGRFAQRGCAIHQVWAACRSPKRWSQSEATGPGNVMAGPGITHRFPVIGYCAGLF